MARHFHLLVQHFHSLLDGVLHFLWIGHFTSLWKSEMMNRYQKIAKATNFVP